MTTTDVLVIGGGPAGAAAACRLAEQGVRVVLYERRAEPRPQVCGEFLSGAAAAELSDLGAAPAQLGARPITRLRVASGGSAVSARLPAPAYGLSRTRLERSLLQRAADAGVELRTGVGVRRLGREGNAWSATLSGTGRIKSAVVVLATGKHDLRGHRRESSTGADMLGFKMHFRLRPDQLAALGDAVELYPYGGGYAGLQAIETGAANLCFIAAARDLDGGDAWRTTLARLLERVPALGERLRDADPLHPRPASVARVPYGYLCRPADAVDGIYRVGDQAAVIPSFAGEGIAIALRSARIAARAIAAGECAERYARTVRHALVGPLRRARMVEAALHRRPLLDLGLAVATVPGILPALARLTRLDLRARD